MLRAPRGRPPRRLRVGLGTGSALGRMGRRPMEHAPQAPSKPGLLFMTESLRSSGIARVMPVRSRWFSERGYRVQIHAWNIFRELSGRPNPILAELAACRVPVVDLSMNGRVQTIRRAVRVARSARREHLSVVVGHGFLGGLTAVLAQLVSGRRLRAIVELRVATSVYVDEFSPTTRRLARLVFRWADGILAVSEGVRKDSARYFGVPADRITMNPQSGGDPQGPSPRRRGASRGPPRGPPLHPRNGAVTLHEEIPRSHSGLPSRPTAASASTGDLRGRTPVGAASRMCARRGCGRARTSPASSRIPSPSLPEPGRWR